MDCQFGVVDDVAEAGACVEAVAYSHLHYDTSANEIETVIAWHIAAGAGYSAVGHSHWWRPG